MANIIKSYPCTIAEYHSLTVETYGSQGKETAEITINGIESLADVSLSVCLSANDARDLAQRLLRYLEENE